MKSVFITAFLNHECPVFRDLQRSTAVSRHIRCRQRQPSNSCSVIITHTFGLRSFFLLDCSMVARKPCAICCPSSLGAGTLWPSPPTAATCNVIRLSAGENWCNTQPKHVRASYKCSVACRAPVINQAQQPEDSSLLAKRDVFYVQHHIVLQRTELITSLTVALSHAYATWRRASTWQ